MSHINMSLQNKKRNLFQTLFYRCRFKQTRAPKSNQISTIDSTTVIMTIELT